MSALNRENLKVLKECLTHHPPHLQAILSGAVASFSDTSNPLRFTNTATCLRELLRELFVSISPDQCIKRCSWFTSDPSSNTGVTRRHRTLFAVYSYVHPAHYPNNFVSEVETVATMVSKQIKNLCTFTHVTKTILETPERTAIATFDSTLGLFLRLFEAIASGREQLLDTIEIELRDRIADIFISDFFDELDILSTHTRPQDTYAIQLEIEDIDEEAITFSGTGDVLCDLQYGSDGDCRCGEGLKFSDSYPFTFSGETLTANPREVTVERREISVDTSSFYE